MSESQDSQIEKIAQIAERISAEENRRTRQTHTINTLLEERRLVETDATGRPTLTAAGERRIRRTAFEETQR